MHFFVQFLVTYTTNRHPGFTHMCRPPGRGMLKRPKHPSHSTTAPHLPLFQGTSQPCRCGCHSTFSILVPCGCNHPPPLLWPPMWPYQPRWCPAPFSNSWIRPWNPIYCERPTDCHTCWNRAHRGPCAVHTSYRVTHRKREGRIGPYTWAVRGSRKRTIGVWFGAFCVWFPFVFFQISSLLMCARHVNSLKQNMHRTKAKHP